MLAAEYNFQFSPIELATKELSSESVYQQSFVEKNEVFLNSGINIDTNCFTARKAGSGMTVHSSTGRGTDHWPSCAKEASGGAG
jgi:hypothetical protein